MGKRWVTHMEARWDNWNKDCPYVMQLSFALWAHDPPEQRGLGLYAIYKSSLCSSILLNNPFMYKMCLYSIFYCIVQKTRNRKDLLKTYLFSYKIEN